MKKIILFSVLLMGFVLNSNAVDLAQKKQSYVHRQQAAVDQLISVLSTVRNLRLEWDAEGFSGTFTDQDMIDAGFPYMSAADLTSIVVSEQAITDLLAAGGNAHNTNLYKIVR